MMGRTLLQPAPPITIGLKTSQRLWLVHNAGRRFNTECDRAVALQFGGAAGSRAGLEGKGSAMAIHLPRPSRNYSRSTKSRPFET
ncbi:MAG: hypothetical protein AB7O04_11840 [Hyphomonadaceae bacterium]